MEKLYTSSLNYYVGNEPFKAGSVFTKAQWEAAGGKGDDLDLHVKKGYITETVQVVSEDIKPKQEVKEEEEAKEEPKQAPTGVWNFKKEELEALPLEALNTLYKDRAAEYGLTARMFKDKEALIEKMTSEG